MGKREREDALSASATGTKSAVEPVTKKIKVKKDRETGNGLEEEDRETKRQRKQEKAARKALKQAQREAKEPAADTSHERSSKASAKEGLSDADAAAVAKAERKAAKRAKRAAREAEAMPDTASSQSNGHTAVNGVHEIGESVKTVTEPTSYSSGYTEPAALSAVPQAEIDKFVNEKSISVVDPDASAKKYRPIVSFDQLPISDPAQRAPLANYKTPTPIQAAAWPYLFAGRDVIGVAETGSGKTLAFGIPCVRHITSLTPNRRKKAIQACIVSPTRELALQIHEQLSKLATPAGLKATCVYGGVNKDQQRETISGASIIVATPGRLNDFIEEGSIDLSDVRYLVLDEADRMLDTGFEMEVRKIISAASPEGRQTLMFTATWPPSVRELAGTFMRSPVRVSIGDNPTGELRANARIVQEVEVIDPNAKNDRLLSLLKQYQSGKNKGERILVFCLYKKEATRIEGFIRSRGFNVAGIHGDLSQQQRTASLDAFKQGKVPLLVATDVAARGLDIPAVKVVINVTFPLTVEDYVHRIGR